MSRRCAKRPKFTGPPEPLEPIEPQIHPQQTQGMRELLGWRTHQPSVQTLKRAFEFSIREESDHAKRIFMLRLIGQIVSAFNRDVDLAWSRGQGASLWMQATGTGRSIAEIEDYSRLQCEVQKELIYRKLDWPIRCFEDFMLASYTESTQWKSVWICGTRRVDLGPDGAVCLLPMHAITTQIKGLSISDERFSPVVQDVETASRYHALASTLLVNTWSGQAPPAYAIAALTKNRLDIFSFSTQPIPCLTMSSSMKTQTWCTCVVISGFPMGELIVCGAGDGSLYLTLLTQTGIMYDRTDAHKCDVTCVTLIQTDSLETILVSAGLDGQILMWNLQMSIDGTSFFGPSTRLGFHGVGVSCIARFNPNDMAPICIASGSWDGTVCLWDLSNPGQPIKFEYLSTEQTQDGLEDDSPITCIASELDRILVGRRSGKIYEFILDQSLQHMGFRMKLVGEGGICIDSVSLRSNVSFSRTRLSPSSTCFNQLIKKS